MAVSLAAFAGVGIVAQNGVNTNLRAHAVPAPFLAACINFSVGFAAILVVAILHRPRCGDTTLRQAPWYSLTGGLLGPIYVVTAILLSSQLGFAAFQLCAIAGQILMSLGIDAVGLLHMQKRRPTLSRVLAICGVVGGAALASSNVDVSTVAAGRVPLYCLAALCAGSVFPLQAVVNSSLQRHVLTPYRAVSGSFLVGMLSLLLVSVLTALASGSLNVSGGEPWMWTGGILGAAIVTCNVVGTPLIGAAAYTAAFLTSQLVAAFVFDVTGAFGFVARPLTALRLAGVIVAMVGAAVYQFAPKGEVVAKHVDEESVARAPERTDGGIALHEVGPGHCDTAVEGVRSETDV